MGLPKISLAKNDSKSLRHGFPTKTKWVYKRYRSGLVLTRGIGLFSSAYGETGPVQG